MSDLTAPFPWFGGKSKVAPEVWAALGDVENYVEPFAGSLAVLLGRPSEHIGGLEIVNDIDMHLVNFWRALQHDPALVAHYANNPANEADLTARHIWLVNQGQERILRLHGDPDYYDAKVAGWWVWGICSWIGGGWCAGTGPWTADESGRLTKKENGNGVSKQLVYLGNAGRGVNRKRMHLGGQGVKRQRVHLGNAGRGVIRRLVSVGHGRGINRKTLRGDSGGVNTGEAEITAYLSTLAERLRYVRVCVGDWKRVVTPGALAHGYTVGVFLDPPYDVDIRYGNIYNSDAEYPSISAEVREWCIANGDNPRYRIVLAGYDGEHEMPASWRVHAWKSGATYQRSNRGTANEVNRHKERLWFSPNCCLQPDKQRTMF